MTHERTPKTLQGSLTHSLTHVLNLGDDAGCRAVRGPVLLVDVRDEPSDRPHVLCLAHEGCCHEVDVILNAVTRGGGGR